MQAMVNLDWRALGYLTPDAPECQRDVWALLGRLLRHLARIDEDLALRSAEPTWAATLRDGAGRANDLAAQLEQEAGPEALERLAEDEALAEFEASLEQVLTSDHVPSMIVTGHVVLGELVRLPARLLEEVAGPNARLLAARLSDCEAHRPLARLFRATDPSTAEANQLRRLLRHLNGQLYVVYATWRQTFHVLGVDGEWMEEEARTTVRAALEALGLKVGPADLAVFRV
jgi:hypothetical protein